MNGHSLFIFVRHFSEHFVLNQSIELILLS